ncbi:MAG: hypothetical protein QM733_03680 [Ilumatobacteraceae bacterium]
MQEAITAFTDCLEQHGISVPDVSTPTGRGNGSLPAGSIPADGQGPRAGEGGPPADGSFPTNGGGGNGGANGGGANGNGGGNGGGGGNGNGGANFTTMIVERLGLDTSDATVKTAVDACSSTLTSASPNGGGAPGDQAPTTTTA